MSRPRQIQAAPGCPQKILVWTEPVDAAGQTSSTTKYNNRQTGESSLKAPARGRRAEQARVRRRREKPLRSIEAFLWTNQRTYGVRERKIRDIARNYPVLQVQNIFKGDIAAELRLDDLCRLEKGQWLTGDVINWAIFSIATSLVGLRKSPYLVYTTNFVSMLRKSPSNHQQQRSIRFWHWSERSRGRGTGKRFVSYKQILVPFNVKDRHWCLAVLEPEHRRVRIFNSAINCMKEETAEIAKSLAEYGSERSGMNATWEIADVRDLDQQQNGYDCGVFVCAYIETLLKDKDPVTSVNCDTVKELRARLLVLALEISTKI